MHEQNRARAAFNSFSVQLHSDYTRHADVTLHFWNSHWPFSSLSDERWLSHSAFFFFFLVLEPQSTLDRSTWGHWSERIKVSLCSFHYMFPNVIRHLHFPFQRGRLTGFKRTNIYLDADDFCGPVFRLFLKNNGTSLHLSQWHCLLLYALEALCVLHE